ncbi:MAG: cytochrome c [Pseudomonadota bacterium]
MNLSKVALTLLIMLPGFATLSAGDIAKGKAKSAVCAACHGADGKAVIKTYPSLAGQNKEYLISSIKAYRDGQRNNPLMSPMSKGLTDEDIANLAAYYSSLK